VAFSAGGDGSVRQKQTDRSAIEAPKSPGKTPGFLLSDVWMWPEASVRRVAAMRPESGVDRTLHRRDAVQLTLVVFVVRADPLYKRVAGFGRGFADVGNLLR
jgi:hypothetical protein